MKDHHQIYNLSKKRKSVYIIKKCVRVCVCGGAGGCLDKYISAATCFPQTKIPDFALDNRVVKIVEVQIFRP